jgi:hypothetical protein
MAFPGVKVGGPREGALELVFKCSALLRIECLNENDLEPHITKVDRHSFLLHCGVFIIRTQPFRISIAARSGVYCSIKSMHCLATASRS